MQKLKSKHNILRDKYSLIKYLRNIFKALYKSKQNQYFPKWGDKKIPWISNMKYEIYILIKTQLTTEPENLAG